MVDSGATHNFVTSLEGVTNLDPTSIQRVRIASGEMMESKGTGLFNGFLLGVYMPSFSCNLCSVSTMADLGYSFKLGIDNCVMIQEETGRVVAPVVRVGNLIILTSK